MFFKLFNAYRIYCNATAAAKEDISAAKKSAIEECTKEFEKQCREATKQLKAEAEEMAEQLSKEAYDKGFKSGVESGTEQGRTKGFHAVLELFGYTFPPEDIPAMLKKQCKVDMHARNWPNIYDTGTHYVVRLILDGERFCESFYYKSTPKYRRFNNRENSVLMHEPNLQDKEKALFKAVRCVHSYIPVRGDSDVFANSIEEILDDYGVSNPRENLVSFDMVTRAAAEFHRRALVYSERWQLPAWVGECPAGRFRFGDDARQRLSRKWSWLFTKVPQRMAEGFYLAGLGYARTKTERTVRDLLMITPDELKDINGLGAVTVNKIQRELRQNFGLYLWGEGPVSAGLSDDQGMPYNRNYRAIDLGGDDD